MVHFVFMNSLIFFFFFFVVLINPLVVVVFGLNFDGQILISLLNNWNASEEIKSSWNTSDSTPCNWIGIQCNSNNSSVLSLDLSNHPIYGPLGPQIGKLNYLNEIFLSNTNLSGRIPIEIGNCSHLKHLDLSENYLVGKIPESLFEIPHLNIVHLSFNNLSGSVPFNIGNATELTSLWLNSNNLTGHIPSSLGLLPDITDLSLSKNHLSGKIPNEIFEKCRSLEELDLDENQLSGGIPVEITKLRELRNLSLSNNRFTGVVPKTLGINSSLTWVFLNNNKFSGEIPPNLCYGKQLITLRMDYNQFHGNIPSNLTSTCYSLQNLDLCGNQLSGTIPPFPSNNSLLYLNLKRNYIEGPLPRSLVNCERLQFLVLGNNQINDTFPIWMESLPDLVLVSLRSNRFHGPIIMNSQKKIITHNQLKIIDISYNNFSGELPSEFFSQLIVLMNSSLYKFGSIDNEHVNRYANGHTSLIYKGKEIILNQTMVADFGLIDFSNNRFQGKLPESLGQLKVLNSLNLSNNNFNGPIPSSLGNMTLLESLDLSKNKLTGGIPWQLTQLSFLSTLNLSENQLTGHIPTAGQFQTFEESSFKGNLGLCGNQLSRNSCDRGYHEYPENPSAAPRNEQNHTDSIFNQGFGWESVLIGYSFGLALVFFTQTIVFSWTYCKRNG